MATFKLIYTSVFLLAIVFSYVIISSEGRQLRTQNKKCETHVAICENNAREMRKNSVNNLNHLRRGILDHEASTESAPPAGQTQSPGLDNVEASTDDFRPTDPGHSPGAGHSKGTQIVDPN
uniref:Uncharacterized protein n=1 Tax=Fagus sylvatica TaxID=28930 RepID=A0A2N9HT26_FAGSY